MDSYPVAFDVERPAAFQRAHVFLRLVILILLGVVVGGWFAPFGLVFLAFPVLAAVFVAQKGGRRYVEEDGPAITGVLRWVVGALAYLAALTDRLPGGGGGEPVVRFDVQRSGSPTVGSALLRIVYAIPSAIALTILGVASSVVWLVALIGILLTESYPEALWRFQRAIVRWDVRLLVYLSSLVEPYPPYRIDMGAEPPGVPA